MSDLFTELKRRNVFRVVLLYLIAGWLILQIGDILFPALGVPEWGIKFVLGLLILGFPLAVIFSWAFEMTPEGLKKEKDVDRTQSITGQTGRKINGLIIGLLVIAVGLLAFNTFRAPQSIEVTEQQSDSGTPVTQVASGEPTRVVLPEDKSIAVLPFVNLSGDAENEYFSDGLAETLLHMLAQVQDLRVAARTSSFQFKGHTGDMDEIGEQLNVSTVLEGSVRKAQNKVRVTAQLINVADGYHMWSGTYDRELDDVFAIQDEIAMKVVEALKGELLGDQADRLTLKHTEDLDAYEAFLQGRKEQMDFTFEGLERSEDFFERALEIDPGYAMAHVGLAETYLLKANTGVTDLPLVAIDIERNAQRALELDPDLGEAYALLGFVAGFEGDLDAAETLFLRALELNPSYPNTYLWTARMDRFQSQLTDAEKMIRLGLEIDPLSSHMQWELGRILEWQQRFDESIQAYERTVFIAPDNPNGYSGLAMLHRTTGDFPASIRYMKQSGKRDPDDYEYASEVAILYGLLGDSDRASAWLEVAQQLGPGETMPIGADAIVNYLRGDHEEAARISKEFLMSGQGSRHFAGAFMRQMLANVDLQSLGEAVSERLRLRDPDHPLLQEMPEPEGLGFGGASYDGLLLAMAYREAGEHAKADHLIESLIALVEAATDDERTMPAFNVVALGAYALAGRKEEFLELLHPFVAAPGGLRLGYQIFWRDGPQYDSMRDLPEFQAILEELEASREPMRMVAAEADATE